MLWFSLMLIHENILDYPTLAEFRRSIVTTGLKNCLLFYPPWQKQELCSKSNNSHNMMLASLSFYCGYVVLSMKFTIVLGSSSRFWDCKLQVSWYYGFLHKVLGYFSQIRIFPQEGKLKVISPDLWKKLEIFVTHGAPAMTERNSHSFFSIQSVFCHPPWPVSLFCFHQFWRNLL